jgi:hypothetical protein
VPLDVFDDRLGTADIGQPLGPKSQIPTHLTDYDHTHVIRVPHGEVVTPSAGG